MTSNRRWMYERWDGQYLNSDFASGVDRFLEFSKHEQSYIHSGQLRCPCSKCKNLRFHDVEQIREHLYRRGFVKNYYEWVHHGESYVDVVPLSSESNPYRDMVMDVLGPNYENFDGTEGGVEEEPHPEAKKLLQMLKDAQKPLYEGCSRSLLGMASQIINMKSEFNLPHRCVDRFSSILHDCFPNQNVMTSSFSETRRIVEGLELPHEKIHVCPNGCLLFWQENTNLDSCFKCGENRYKMTSSGKLVPTKVLIYFPITPRLQRLYATEYIAKQMRWHAEHHCIDGVMEHPSDGEAWRHVDTMYSDFAQDPRNVRLGLCTDGFAPFAKSASNYSCWPVLITPYNLPPWLCMKNQFLFLTLIIPGPKSPKGNLDVFLQPVIQELRGLWEFGALTYDMSRKQNFMLRALLLWTISDFPAYGMLSGWSTSGKLACPCCMKHTKSFWLKYGRKVSWFDCHRQFLCANHPYRRNRTGFYKNRVEDASPPPRLSGDQLWEEVANFPKSTDPNVETEQLRSDNRGWYKQSIFWQLPYWRNLLIRHNLDVMHIEKNVFEQLIHTIMGHKGKTQDNLQARKDIQLYCRRPSLYPIDDGKGGFIIPKAPYVLDKQEKIALCKWVSTLKFPDGYASNLSRCVDKRLLQLYGLKIHDCHVFLERLLPVAVKELLPPNIWKAVTELSQFFRDLCASSLKVDDMVCLQHNIPEILCKLEKIFPPSFFNVMEHLPIHLPYEAMVGGPVHYRWMYRNERKMFNLKQKIGNKARVEGSICNAYLNEEISNFCCHYFEEDVDTKARDLARNAVHIDVISTDLNLPEIFRVNLGRASSQGHLRYLDDKEFQHAHLYVLRNCGILSEYERMFEHYIMLQHPNVPLNLVWTLHENEYPKWLENYVLTYPVNNILYTLAMKPLRQVRTWRKYFINGFNFHTYEYGRKKGSLNYGVSVRDSDGVEYYGLLVDVIELIYIGDQQHKIVLFKCDWFDPRHGINTHEQYKLVEINCRRRYPKYDPFVMAHQVHQVYYAPTPSLKNDRVNWWAVFRMRSRPTYDTQVDDFFQEDAIVNTPTLAADENENGGDYDDDQWDDIGDWEEEEYDQSEGGYENEGSEGEDWSDEEEGHDDDHEVEDEDENNDRIIGIVDEDDESE